MILEIYQVTTVLFCKNIIRAAYFTLLPYVSIEKMELKDIRYRAEFIL